MGNNTPSLSMVEAAFRFKRFSERAMKVMDLAEVEAQRLSGGEVRTEHLILAMAKLPYSIGGNLLNGFGVDLGELQAAAECVAKATPKEKPTGSLSFSPAVQKVIQDACEEADSLNNHYVGTEHLLLALLRDRNGGSAPILSQFGIDHSIARAEILAFLRDEGRAVESGGIV